MNKEDIFNKIVAHTCDVIPTLKDHQFSFQDSLKNLGANSIDRTDIVMMTLESLSVRIPLIELAKAENIGALAGLIYERM